MVKLYRLKYNLPTFWKGDIAILKEDGNLWFVGNENPELRKKEKELHWKDSFVMYNSKTLENFKILETYFEELSEELVRKVWPFEGCSYWYINDIGVELAYWCASDDDFTRKSMGNCFLCKEDAEKAWEKIKSVCKLNLLGLRMDSFSSGKDGHAYLTCKFPQEYQQGIHQTLRSFMEEVDEY